MPDIENLPLVISFSGGETSSVMAELLVNKWKGKRQIISVFANTGKERKETLEFANNVDKYLSLGLVWVEAKVNKEHKVGTDYSITCFDEASRTGEPFKNVISKYGIPNQAFKHCTRELKTNPIKKYLQSIGLKDYVVAIGYRADEMRRVNWDKAKKEKQYYPLVETWRMNKEMVKSYCQKRPFQLGLKSHQGNCDFCWKKSKRKLLTLIKEDEKAIKWWHEMECKYGDLVVEGRSLENQNPPYVFFRDNTSAKELIEESHFEFEKYDDFEDRQMMLFDPEFDYEGDECGSGSCEPF
jgi:3'-phosphoadenosine 5'-phosphosulfate sulfotransferase (PAPS reductase)/FAD synthetase